MRPVQWTTLIVLMWLMSASAQAQFLVVPHEHRIPIMRSFSIKSITMDAKVEDQVAQVQVAQVLKNNSSAQMEATFIFPIPPDAAISQFMLMIDGKEVPAKLYSKQEAQRIYESIVRTRKDPALLEYMGYGALQTSVFPLPPHGERKITLRYTQICRRDGQLNELVFPLMSSKLSAQAVEELKLTVRINSAQKIKSVYSPSYPIGVERPDDRTAIARYVQNGISPTDDFRLFWNISEKPVGATLMSYKPVGSEDGYFLLLASPEVRASEQKVMRKTVIFVIDHSGSMAGRKIEQARNALKFVLNNLREGDTFNIVSYDDRVETFKPELQRFSEETRRDAERFVDNIQDGGSTNIDGALRRAFELVGDTNRPTYVIFLTDGLPTAGEKNPQAIASNAKMANHGRARLFAFGVGFDVNARLLDQLATENSGTSEYVRPNEDIESSVARFFGRMTAPVMTELAIELAGAETHRVYPRDIPDLFAGGQIICVGRYRNSGDVTIRLKGRVGDKRETFEFPAELARASGNEAYAFVEKLWATRRVGEIINELDLKGRNEELIDELVRLSTRHGILTPYTAFLADERTELLSVRENVRAAGRYAFEAQDSLANNVTGAAGVNLRAAKAEMQQAVNQPSQGVQRYRDARGQYQVAANCQVVGNKALFRRDNRWIDPTVTPDEEKKAQVVEQFSDDYFELARNNQNLRKYLAMPEGCTVRIDGQVYQIRPQQGNRG